MIRMLVSVRDPAEAIVVARCGADLIDLKDPARGALGGLAPETITCMVGALRDAGAVQPVSATIGDLAMHERDSILARVGEVAACGVDLVKVGIERAAGARAVLDALAGCGARVVPVFIAERGFDDALVAHAAGLGFPALMADTADKRGGSLFDRVPMPRLARFVGLAREAGLPVGLAGALRPADLQRLAALAPDFAGFRSAVCSGARSDALDPQRLAALAAALREAQCGRTGRSPSSIDRMRSIAVR